MGQEKYPSITPDLNANGHKIFEYESCTHTPKTTNPNIIANKYSILIGFNFSFS
jgi:hypothetical protein